MRARLHKKERMSEMVRFLVTPAMRERLWTLCAENGLIPSEVLRTGLLKELDRLERETTKTQDKREEVKPK